MKMITFFTKNKKWIVIIGSVCILSGMGMLLFRSWQNGTGFFTPIAERNIALPTPTTTIVAPPSVEKVQTEGKKKKHTVDN